MGRPSTARPSTTGVQLNSYGSGGTSGGGGGGSGAPVAVDDAELARQLQEEWAEEEATSAAPAVAAAGAAAAGGKGAKVAARKGAPAEVPPSTFAGPILTRHSIQAMGWRKVYARLHGSTFAVYPSESAKAAETEVEVSGARLAELGGKGGLMSRKDNIHRFGIVSGGAGKAPSDKEVARWAADTEEARGLWLAYLVLAGAERPEPGLLCKCMQPLLQRGPSEERGKCLGALADVLKQAVEAGEAGPVSAALHDSGLLADVIGCLAAAPGQEHAARIIFYVSGNAACQGRLHEAGAVAQLLDLLTTPDDQLQTWCVAALRPLVANHGAATAQCLEADGIFVLSSLLASPSPGIQVLPE